MSFVVEIEIEKHVKHLVHKSTVYICIVTTICALHIVNCLGND